MEYNYRSFLPSRYEYSRSLMFWVFFFGLSFFFYYAKLNGNDFFLQIKREAHVTEYKKYLTTRKTRYTELMLIVDSEVYKKYKKDINDVKRRVFTLVNAVDAIYSKINIRVALSALEIWTDTDHVPFVSKAGTDLDNFKNHHSSNLAGVKYDSIHLLRGKMWDDYGGMAYKGSICGRTSLGVDAWNYWGSLGPWLALSHELGHNFNFDHDDIWPTCKCLSPRGCIMGSFKTRVPGFSDCNLHNMSSIDDSCLYNFPRKVVNSQCGNGIREPREVCDCGTPEECTVRDPCCEPNDCSLKSSSQCSDVIHSCCQKCQFSPLGTLCRNSTGECDVPEVCDGKSAQCPLDDHIKDGTSCQGEGEAICFKGGCSSSLDSQCRDLWGPEALSAPTACYNELNRNGQGFGACSSRGNVPCGKSHTKCGQLQCYTNARDWPVVDYGNYYELKVLATGDRCRAVSRKTSGGNVGMVKEGTACKNNKICVANKCTGVKQSSSNDCPRTPDGKECGGKGVCTNRGKCYCQGNLDSETSCRSEKQARDGGWGAWSKWTNCTRVCGKGTKTRHRFCNNPAPVYDGQPCAGGRIQTVACNIKTCPVIHSCRRLLSLGRETGVQFPDGVYTINPDGKGPVNTYCDMTRDGGGWTLLVTSHTNTWTANNLKERNTKQPTLNGDFSILNKADDIKNTLMAEGDWFEYRIEANERGRWGGIWRAPRDYTFVALNNKQTNVKLLKRFDNWKYDDYGIEKRMPWISGAKLTTSQNATGDRQWGTLIGNSKLFFPAPWLDGKDLEQHPVNIWYWIREPSYKPPKSCLDVQLRILANNKLLQDGIYTITLGNRDIQTHCKFSAYGGGWTLLLTSASDNGWTRDNLKSRNMGTPAMNLDFSILEMADKITNTKHFQYLIEEDSVKTWQGVWATKAGCALVSARSNKPCTKLVHRQGNWDSDRAKSFTRLPYLTTLGSTALLSSASDENSLNGAIVIDSAKRVQRQRAGVIRLWLREGTWRSCNELKTKKRGRGAPLKDGLYMIHQTSQYFPVYCDMTSETGAYTLLVTSSTNGWSKSKVNFKNPSRPSLVRDYSILGLADKIKALCGGTSFKYRLEANERGHWGGVWTAPISYSFVSQHNRQTNVTLVKKFDDWEYDWRDSLERRMPWLGERKGLLTTSTHADYSNWGSIISETKEYNPAPWIYYKMANPGVIWYWVNEDDNCNYDKKHFVLSASESPIRSYGELCLQPQSGNCSPPDNTPLVYVQDTPKCSKDYMMFTYEDGVLTHKCSGKKVCPNGEIPTWFTPLVVSSTCNEAASKFKWTFHQTFKHSSGFCVHPMSGTPLNGTTAILYKDACDEGRLKLDLFKLPVYQSPIRALGEFCLVPESASCDPPDNTRLVYRKEAECTASFMYFTYKGGVLTHSCSGKRVCPQGGRVGWGTPLVVSGTCPPKASVFHRTPNKTLRPNAAKYCVHPYGGPPEEGLHVITWKDENCNEKRLQLDFYKLRGPT
ncbi:uncharacterized protein [Montipora capricornis]|uniref:uncharacterized protein n=1 Tax=Montipora capricornis TaxID=246305 RepID=UPI0035F16F1E